MQLALKLSIAMIAGIVLVLAAQTTYQIQRISAFQERQIGADALHSVRTLSEATGKLWEAAGRERAIDFVELTTSERDQATFHPASPARSAASGKDSARIQRISEGNAWQIVVSAPVRSAGRVVGTLQIHRRLPNEQDYFDAVLRSQTVTTIAAALIASLIALLVGVMLVGRPMAQLSQLAHRIAEGDFSQRSKVTQRDEIGRLAIDLNAMADRLAESQEAIRHERHARTEALEQLRHADRLTTVGKLASSMAHELGTPLNVVSGRAMMIAGDEDLPQDARNNGQIIADQAGRMTGILQELMNFSRRRPPKLVDTPISTVVDHAVALLEPICDKKHVHMVVRGAQSLRAQIDAGKVLQVLTNLMMNGVQAMPKGGTLALKVGSQHVEEPVDRHASGGDFVTIEVCDEGIGIPKQRLGEIFQAFFTTKKAGVGTGLGLSVCHGIVREHGGWIDVQSEPGRGSCFCVYLPESEE